MGSRKFVNIVIVRNSIMSNFTGLAKIQKINNEEPDEFEKSISQALLDLEMNSDMKAHLRELHSSTTTEIVPESANTIGTRIREEIRRKACRLCRAKKNLGKTHKKGQ